MLNLRLSVPFVSRVVPSGSLRFVLAFIVILACGLATGLLLSGNWPSTGNLETLWEFLGISIALGSVALLPMAVFGLYRWVMAGFDREGRRHFIQFLSMFTFVLAALLFALMFREDVSSPFPQGDRCWYSVRDRWTGEVTVKETACPSGWTPRLRREFHHLSGA